MAGAAKPDAGHGNRFLKKLLCLRSGIRVGSTRDQVDPALDAVVGVAAGAITDLETLVVSEPAAGNRDWRASDHCELAGLNRHLWLNCHFLIGWRIWRIDVG